MKRMVCVGSALAVMMVVLAGAGTDEPESIKDIMAKLHKGANAPVNSIKGALKAPSPDWKAIQDQSKDMVILSAGLSKNDPPRGDKAGYTKLANAYYASAKALDEAAQAENKAKSQAALKKIGASCKACHSAHKGQ